MNKLTIRGTIVQTGQEVTVTVEKDSAQTRTEKTIRLFNRLKDVFAQAQGYDREYARHLLKIRNGVREPLDHSNLHPMERHGQMIEFDNRLWFVVSTNEYTQEEANRLVEGTITDCIEAGLSQEIEKYVKERE